MLQHMMQAIQDNDQGGTEPSMRRCSASSSAALIPANVASPEAVASVLRDKLMHDLLHGVVEDREQSLRETTKHIIMELQKKAFYVRALISLLSDLLPQPNSPEITSAQIRGGLHNFQQIQHSLEQVAVPMIESRF